MRKTLARTSTVLTACLLAAYVASIWWGVFWSGTFGNRSIHISVAYGQIGLDSFSPLVWPPRNQQGFLFQRWSEIRAWPWPWWFTLYSGKDTGGAFGGVTISAIGVPMWCPLLLTALPAFLLSRRRALPNHCPTCNYDRSATPNLPCPECGTPSAS